MYCTGATLTVGLRNSSKCFRSLYLFGILAFFLMVGAPYLHAHAPGHRTDQCPASQVLHSGAVVVPAPLVVACDAQLYGSIHVSALPLQAAETPAACQPRAPPC